MNEPDHEVEKSSTARVQHPYCRAFLLVTIWCVAIGLKMVSRHKVWTVIADFGGLPIADVVRRVYNDTECSAN
jgi:hypothetical protein